MGASRPLAAQVSRACEGITPVMRPGWLCPPLAGEGYSFSSPSPLLMHRGLVSMVTPSFSEIPICLCLIILTWASNVADLFLELFPCYSLSLLPSQASPSLIFRNTLLCPRQLASQHSWRWLSVAAGSILFSARGAGAMMAGCHPRTIRSEPWGMAPGICADHRLVYRDHWPD